MNERERRAYAQAHKDDIIDYDAPGVPVAPRNLGQVFSMRLPGEMAIGLRELANRAGLSVSELLRAAANRLLSGRDVLDALPLPKAEVVGFHCSHFSLTSGAGVLGRPSAACGCEMQPIYG